MLKVTVQLENGDQIDFEAKSLADSWMCGDREVKPEMQIELDNIYGRADCANNDFDLFLFG